MSSELDELKAKTKLPLLSSVRVASPCTVDWNGMTPVDGGERVRHCGSCKKNVYHLSSMTRAEAEALIVANEGRLCVRYYQRKDGTIVLADCVVAPSAAKRRLIAAGAAALLATTSGAAWLSRRTDERSMAATIVQPTHEDIRENVEISNGDDPPPPAPRELAPLLPAPPLPAPPLPAHDNRAAAEDHDLEAWQGDFAAPEELQDIKGEM